MLLLFCPFFLCGRICLLLLLDGVSRLPTFRLFPTFPPAGIIHRVTPTPRRAVAQSVLLRTRLAPPSCCLSVVLRHRFASTASVCLWGAGGDERSGSSGRPRSPDYRSQQLAQDCAQLSGQSKWSRHEGDAKQWLYSKHHLNQLGSYSVFHFHKRKKIFHIVRTIGYFWEEVLHDPLLLMEQNHRRHKPWELCRTDRKSFLIIRSESE